MILNSAVLWTGYVIAAFFCGVCGQFNAGLVPDDLIYGDAEARSIEDNYDQQTVGPIVFECLDKKEGYYADVKYDCNSYHYCKSDGSRSTFKCPTGTRFNQRLLICDYSGEEDCILYVEDMETGEDKVQPQYVDIADQRIGRQISSEHLPLEHREIQGISLVSSLMNGPTRPTSRLSNDGRIKYGQVLPDQKHPESLAYRPPYRVSANPNEIGKPGPFRNPFEPQIQQPVPPKDQGAFTPNSFFNGLKSIFTVVNPKKRVRQPPVIQETPYDAQRRRVPHLPTPTLQHIPPRESIAQFNIQQAEAFRRRPDVDEDRREAGIPQQQYRPGPPFRVSDNTKTNTPRREQSIDTNPRHAMQHHRGRPNVPRRRPDEIHRMRPDDVPPTFPERFSAQHARPQFGRSVDSSSTNQVIDTDDTKSIKSEIRQPSDRKIDGYPTFNRVPFEPEEDQRIHPNHKPQHVEVTRQKQYEPENTEAPTTTSTTTEATTTKEAWHRYKQRRPTSRYTTSTTTSTTTYRPDIRVQDRGNSGIYRKPIVERPGTESPNPNYDELLQASFGPSSKEIEKQEELRPEHVYKRPTASYEPYVPTHIPNRINQQLNQHRRRPNRRRRPRPPPTPSTASELEKHIDALTPSFDDLYKAALNYAPTQPTDRNPPFSEARVPVRDVTDTRLPLQQDNVETVPSRRFPEAFGISREDKMLSGYVREQLPSNIPDLEGPTVDYKSSHGIQELHKPDGLKSIEDGYLSNYPSTNPYGPSTPYTDHKQYNPISDPVPVQQEVEDEQLETQGEETTDSNEITTPEPTEPSYRRRFRFPNRLKSGISYRRTTTTSTEAPTTADATTVSYGPTTTRKLRTGMSYEELKNYRKNMLSKFRGSRRPTFGSRETADEDDEDDSENEVNTEESVDSDVSESVTSFPTTVTAAPFTRTSRSKYYRRPSMFKTREDSNDNDESAAETTTRRYSVSSDTYKNYSKRRQALRARFSSRFRPTKTTSEDESKAKSIEIESDSANDIETTAAPVEVVTLLPDVSVSASHDEEDTSTDTITTVPITTTTITDSSDDDTTSTETTTITTTKFPDVESIADVELQVNRELENTKKIDEKPVILNPFASDRNDPVLPLQQLFGIPV